MSTSSLAPELLRSGLQPDLGGGEGKATGGVKVAIWGCLVVEVVRKKSSERISEIDGDLGPETVVVLEEGRSEVKVGLDTCDIGEKYEGGFGKTGLMVKLKSW